MVHNTSQHFCHTHRIESHRTKVPQTLFSFNLMESQIQMLIFDRHADTIFGCSFWLILSIEQQRTLLYIHTHSHTHTYSLAHTRREKLRACSRTDNTNTIEPNKMAAYSFRLTDRYLIWKFCRYILRLRLFEQIAFCFCFYFVAIYQSKTLFWLFRNMNACSLYRMIRKKKRKNIRVA